MTKHHRKVVLLVLVTTVVLLAAFATSASAFTVFDQGQGGVDACVTCHSQSAIHGASGHAPQMANPTASCTASCHVNGTGNPPTPEACASCHGAGVIMARESHTIAGCTSTPGCHGVPAPAPAITGFTPAAGGVGTLVTVTGSHFTGATAVTFNGVAATTKTVVSDTKVTARVPAGATTGKIAVTTGDGTGTSATDFTVLITSKVTAKLVGVKSGILRLGKTVTVKGVVTPFHAAKVTITLQRKVGTKWVTKKTFTRASNATTGAYTTTAYKPGAKGAWRAQVKVAATTEYTKATITKTFRVR